METEALTEIQHHGEHFDFINKPFSSEEYGFKFTKMQERVTISNPPPEGTKEWDNWTGGDIEDIKDESNYQGGFYNVDGMGVVDPKFPTDTKKSRGLAGAKIAVQLVEIYKKGFYGPNYMMGEEGGKEIPDFWRYAKVDQSIKQNVEKWMKDVPNPFEPKREKNWYVHNGNTDNLECIDRANCTQARCKSVYLYMKDDGTIDYKFLQEGDEIPLITTGADGTFECKSILPGHYQYYEIIAPPKEGNEDVVVTTDDNGREKGSETQYDFSVDETWKDLYLPAYTEGAGWVKRYDDLLICDETASGLKIKKIEKDKNGNEVGPMKGAKFTIQLALDNNMSDRDSIGGCEGYVWDEEFVNPRYGGAYVNHRDIKDYSGDADYLRHPGKDRADNEVVKATYAGWKNYGWYDPNASDHEDYEFETDENGEIFLTHLIPGEYIIREVDVPVGFKTPDPVRIHTRKKEYIHPTAYVYNEPGETGDLKVIKIDRKTKERIPGAKFQIMDSKGEKYLQPDGTMGYMPYEFTTDGNGEIIVHDTLEGSYKVKETYVPSPYILSTKEFRVTVPGEVTIQNSKPSEGKGSFRKTIEGAPNVGLEGFEFELKERDIKDEYPEMSSLQCFPYTRHSHCSMSTASEDEWIPRHWVGTEEDGHWVEAHCTIHGSGDSSHIPSYNADVSKYNQLFDELQPNENHQMREEAVKEINSWPLITDEQGYGDISPLSELDDDDKGLIDITETSVGSNPYFNMDSSTTLLKYHEDTILTNKRMRADIEGNIWEDLGFGKDSKSNSIKDANESLLQPIEINLKNGNTVIATGVVTGDGRYRIRVGGEDGYNLQYLTNKSLAQNTYVEFTYNGMIYSSVEPLLGVANGSKATENETERLSMDNDYTTIRAGSGSSSLSNRGTIEYNRNPSKYSSQTRYEGYVKGDLIRGENECTPLGDGQYTVRKMPGEKQEYDMEPGTINERDDGMADNCYYITSQTFGKKYQMHADTKRANFQGFIQYNVGQDTIKNVNLGLYRREQPDLSIVNDIYQVRVEYDGHQYTYQYGLKTDGEGLNKGTLVKNPRIDVTDYQGGSFDVGVKFQDNRKFTYRREVYPSDVEIIPTSGKEINIFVTYKTAIFNESTTLKVRPTELVSHYDQDYIGLPTDVTAKFASQEPNAVGRNVVWAERGYGTPQTSAGYKEAYGRVNGFIDPEQMGIIFTEYKLARQQCLGLLNGDPNASLKFYNHIEVNAYTTQSSNNQNYGGIDKDSQPGNQKPNSKSTYEDDNDEAPVFELAKNTTSPRNRTMEGNVFEDVTELKDYARGVKERIGDGINGDASTDEPPITNVKVQLIEVDYDASTGLWKDSGRVTKLDPNIDNLDSPGLPLAEVTTGDNGNYKFTGYAPGRYLLKFTWGLVDGTTRSVIKDGSTTNINGATIQGTPIYVQQYKSAKFNDQSRYNDYKTYKEDAPSRWYLHAANLANSDSSKSHADKSNAIDEISNQRLNIDENLKDINNTNNFRNFLDPDYKNKVTWDSDYAAQYGESYLGYVNNLDLQQMYSRTVSFDVGIEALWDDNDQVTNVKDGLDRNHPDAKNESQPDHREFEIKDLDFGISERPNMTLTIKKELENVRVILANGQVLVDADVIDNKIEGSILNTKYLKPTKDETYSDIGKLHVEMDQELIHGAILQATYKYTIANESELDYELQPNDNELRSDLNQYYKFGVYQPQEQEVKMKATKVVDYLDNKLNYDEALEDDPSNHPYGADNQKWLRDEIKAKTASSEKGIYDKHEVFNESQKLLSDSYDSDKVVEAIRKEYRTLTRGEQDGSNRENDNGGPLKAGKDWVFRLTATKDLGNTKEDMSYLNTSEIIKINKTGGEYPGDAVEVDGLKGEQPGNATPPIIVRPLPPFESDSWTAEQVTITPPTGDNSRYTTIAWTIVAVISLGTLGVGIIGIKKAGKVTRKIR